MPPADRWPNAMRMMNHTLSVRKMHHDMPVEMMDHEALTTMAQEGDVLATSTFRAGHIQVLIWPHLGSDLAATRF